MRVGVGVAVAVGVLVGVGVDVIVAVAVGVTVAVGVSVAVAVGDGCGQSEVAMLHPVPKKENETSASSVARTSALCSLGIMRNTIDLDSVSPLIIPDGLYHGSDGKTIGAPCANRHRGAM